MLCWVILLMGRRRARRSQAPPLESGMVPEGDARYYFPVKFRLAAMIFMVVEAGAILIFPWAAAFGDALDHGLAALVGMSVFIGMVALALVYAGRKGGLAQS